ncbi:pyrroline-5-carboxylate reductase [Bacillus testis]|uniref:pyrroline-5-carboxylate reductase n=1 Tax=Bacillus testis TaxID=1622072 RepID=UPI00067EA874|nr:pyrroline-5-carboxylate reductase [Bacillus testis]
MKLSFLGCGSMAEAMISGMATQGIVQPQSIFVKNRHNPERMAFLQDTYGVTPASSYEELMDSADIIVLAVKPKDVFQALSEIRESITPDMLILSVAAGVSITSIERIVGQANPVVRCMPNTSAAVGKSATALAHNRFVSADQLQQIILLLQTFGTVSIVDEDQLDAVTGLSGSGPAYIYYLVEAMEAAAAEIGLEQKQGKDLILQTIIGAAEMLKNSPKTPRQLRKEVTSPGGTTEAGIKILQSEEVKQAFINCITEAAKQSKRMGEKLAMEMDEKLTKL